MTQLDPSLERGPDEPTEGYITPEDIQAAIDRAVAHHAQNASHGAGGGQPMDVNAAIHAVTDPLAGDVVTAGHNASDAKTAAQAAQQGVATAEQAARAAEAASAATKAVVDSLTQTQPTLGPIPIFEQVTTGLLSGKPSVWDAANTYDDGDVIVGSDGAFYVALGRVTSDPVTTPQDWQKVTLSEIWRGVRDNDFQIHTVDVRVNELVKQMDRTLHMVIAAIHPDVAPWDAATDYVRGATVFHNDIAWWAHADPAVGDEPGVSNKWDQVSVVDAYTKAKNAVAPGGLNVQEITSADHTALGAAADPNVLYLITG